MFQEQKVCQKVSGVNPRSERRKVLGDNKMKCYMNYFDLKLVFVESVTQAPKPKLNSRRQEK